MAATKYNLKTVDGRQITVEAVVCAQSGYIKSLFQDFPSSGEEQTADLVHELCTYSVVERIVSWLTKTHEMAQSNASTETYDQYNKEFFGAVSPDPASPSDLLFHILVICNYLDIPPLLDLACKKMAEYVRSCKTPEEMREMFKVTGDFTPEEDEAARKKYAWCDNVLQAQ